jgi:hypothetical protein
MKLVRKSIQKFLLLLAVTAILGVNHSQAADIWTELTNADFTTNNQSIREFSQFAGATFFTAESDSKPFEIYGYYSGDFASFGDTAPFYNAVNAIKVKTGFIYAGILVVVVETTTTDQLWFYTGSWENVTGDLPAGTVKIESIKGVADFALLAFLEIEDGDGTHKSMAFFTGSDWVTSEDFGDLDINNLQILDTLYAEIAGNPGLLLTTYNPATDSYSISASAGSTWAELLSSEYPIYDIAVYDDASYILVGSSSGVQIQRFTGELEVVKSGLNPGITQGKLAQSDDYLYAAFSKPNSGGPAEIYRSSDGTTWKLFTNVVGDGTTAELAWVTEFIPLGSDLLIGSAQRGTGGNPTNAQLWLLEIDESAHADGEEPTPDPDPEPDSDGEPSSNPNTGGSRGGSALLPEDPDTDGEGGLIPEQTGGEVLPRPQAPAGDFQPDSSPEQATSASPVVAMLLCLVLLIVAGFVGFFAIKKRKEKLKVNQE